MHADIHHARTCPLARDYFRPWKDCSCGALEERHAERQVLPNPGNCFQDGNGAEVNQRLRRALAQIASGQSDRTVALTEPPFRLTRRRMRQVAREALAGSVPLGNDTRPTEAGRA